MQNATGINSSLSAETKLGTLPWWGLEWWSVNILKNSFHSQLFTFLCDCFCNSKWSVLMMVYEPWCSIVFLQSAWSSDSRILLLSRTHASRWFKTIDSYFIWNAIQFKWANSENAYWNRILRWIHNLKKTWNVYMYFAVL